MRLLALAAALLASFSGAAAPNRLAPANGEEISLEVEKTGLMSGRKHLFIFERYSGTVEFDRANPERSRVEISLESASIMLKDTWLSASDFQKVQSYATEEMLAVRQFPVLTFRSTAVRPLSPAKFRIDGELTIRGVTKPVSLDAEMMRSDPISFALSGTLRLRDFGLKPPTAALGLIGTRNEMSVRGKLTLLPAGP